MAPSMPFKASSTRSSHRSSGRCGARLTRPRGRTNHTACRATPATALPADLRTLAVVPRLIWRSLPTQKDRSVDWSPSFHSRIQIFKTLRTCCQGTLRTAWFPHHCWCQCQPVSSRCQTPATKWTISYRPNLPRFHLKRRGVNYSSYRQTISKLSFARSISGFTLATINPTHPIR